MLAAACLVTVLGFIVGFGLLLVGRSNSFALDKFNVGLFIVTTAFAALFLSPFYLLGRGLIAIYQAHRQDAGNLASNTWEKLEFGSNA